MRYLESSGRWVSTDEPTTSTEVSEQLVDRGLLHPDNLSLAHDPDLLRNGIVPSSFVRLTDGPGNEQRWASYYDVMMTNPWGYGTIHTIARGLGRLPLKIYEPDLADNAEPGTVAKIVNPDRKTPAGRVAWALRYPNIADDGLPAENSPVSRKALLYATVIAKMIHGNAVWEKRKGGDGQLLGFTFHPSEQIDLDEAALVYNVTEPLFGGLLGDFRERRVRRTLSADKVCHFGLWEGGRRPWTLSPVRALHASIALYDAVTRHMVAFFNNGARVSGHLQVTPTGGQNHMSGKARDAIREEIRKLYSGVDNAGRVLVTEGNWQQMHREPQFDGIVNLMKFSRDEIFVTYGVPPPVMGVIERAIMSNAREMRDQYVRDLIGPHAELMAADFESQVIDKEADLRDKQIFCEFDVDEQLRPDLWKRAASFRNILLGYTVDELRRIERQPAIAGSENDPNNYAATINRPLNESPLTNLPDYVTKDEVMVRRVELEEQRLEMEREVAGQPTGDGGEGARQAQVEAQQRASIEARRLALEEQRQAHVEAMDERRAAQDDDRIAIEQERAARAADLAELAHDHIDMPRVGLDDRRVTVEEKRAEHDIAHGTGTEAHGPNSAPAKPAAPADNQPAPQEEPNDDED